MAAEDLSDEIAGNAQGPAEVQGDEGRVRQQSIADLIAADRYLASKDAVHNANDKRSCGIVFVRVRPPGAV